MEVEFEPSTLDLEGPIIIEVVKIEIQAKGVLRFSKPNLPIQTFLNIVPCACSDDGCDEDVVTVVRVNGLSEMNWLLSPEDLLEFESLDKFSDWVTAFGLECSRGERLSIEFAILDHIGTNFRDVDEMFCSCESCRKEAGEDLIWRQTLLRTLAFGLRQREEILEWADENYGEDMKQTLSETYDDGYWAGRMFSEYRLKERVEKPALIGMKVAVDQEARAQAAGRSSQEKRKRRIESMLTAMEEIANRSPDIARLGPEALGKLALGDAAKLEPELWSQGKGQGQEYLDEMRSDHRYFARYKAIFT